MLFIVKYLSLERDFSNFIFLYVVYIFFCPDQLVLFFMFPLLLALTCFYSADSIPCLCNNFNIEVVFLLQCDISLGQTKLMKKLVIFCKSMVKKNSCDLYMMNLLPLFFFQVI